MPQPSQTMAERDMVRQLDVIVYGKAAKTANSLVGRRSSISKSIRGVEALFQRHVEFDSKYQLYKKLQGSIKPSVLNVILAKLIVENKIMVDDDKSLTWISIANNPKMQQLLKRSRLLRPNTSV